MPCNGPKRSSRASASLKSHGTSGAVPRTTEQACGTRPRRRRNGRSATVDSEYPASRRPHASVGARSAAVAPVAGISRSARQPRLSAVIASRISRETCIWERPSCSAISRWVRSSKNRRRSSRCSRGGRRESRRSRSAVRSTRPNSVVLDGHRLQAGGSVLVVDGDVERGGAVRAAEPARLQDHLGRGFAALRDLGHRRRPAQLAQSGFGDAVHRRREFLERAWNAHRPAEVAEVAFELADDRGHGERREGDPARGIEAVDGLQQAERRDLFEVVALSAEE